MNEANLKLKKRNTILYMIVLQLTLKTACNEEVLQQYHHAVI